MVTQRFADFWTSQKTINEAIFYRPNKSHSQVYLLEEVGFVGMDCEGIYVSGNYNCRDGSMTVNFYLKGVGSVRRFCLGGPDHGDAGRFHEHILEKDSDAYPENNLPYAIARPDMEGLDPEVAWRKICGEASVSHTDRYSDPREWCK
jgi:hypothetical protein